MPILLQLIAVLSLLGIVNAGYLLFHNLRGTPVRCIFFSPESCRAVERSRQSRILGIPNAFWGVLTYAAVFMLSFAFAEGTVSVLILKTIAGVGCAFSLYFLYVQKFVLKAFCGWCVLSAVDSLVLFILTLMLPTCILCG